MKFMKWSKDGGPESHVWGFFLIEIKSLFTIALMKFEDGSRDAYHSHAFNALSWLFKGYLLEYQIDRAAAINTYKPSITPIYTSRDMFHQVVSKGTSWVLSLRGPWDNTWQEYTTQDNLQTLTHGRKVI